MCRLTGTRKAITYSPLPPLELGAETDRRSLYACNPLQAALRRPHNFLRREPHCPARSSVPVLLFQSPPQ